MDMARRFHGESPIHSELLFSEAKVDALLRASLVDPDWLPAVACSDDGVIGMALIYALPQFFSEDVVAGDFAFYVDFRQRGTRAAIQLLDYIRQWANAKGARRLDIGINTGINHDQAERFFTRMGLPRVGLIVGTTLPL